MTTEPTIEQSLEPRAKERVWCPALRQWIRRLLVADHLEAVHGIKRTMIIQAYGGRRHRGR